MNVARFFVECVKDICISPMAITAKLCCFFPIFFPYRKCPFKSYRVILLCIVSFTPDSPNRIPQAGEAASPVATFCAPIFGGLAVRQWPSHQRREGRPPLPDQGPCAKSPIPERRASSRTGHCYFLKSEFIALIRATLFGNPNSREPRGQ